MFFVSATSTYGILLLWCGITYFIGQLLFLLHMKKGMIETSNLTTNAKFWFNETGGIRVANSMRLLTIFTFLIILFLELYIGSEIINYYTNDLDMPSWIGFAFITLVVVAYVRLGGMNVVLKTDRWQYMLMLAACLLLLIAAVGYANQKLDLSAGDVSVLNVLHFPDELDTFHLVLFMGWIGIQNLTLPFTQLSSWQRLAATRDVNSALDGFKAVGGGFAILWFVPVFALMVLHLAGANIANVGDLFNIVRSLPGSVMAAAYAIIFVGFASALFSTADSAMIAVELSIAERLGTAPGSGLDLDKRKLNLIIGGISIGLVTTYSLVESEVGENFLSVIYVLFSQLAIIAPHLILVLVRKVNGLPSLDFSARGDWLVTTGIWLSWLVLMVVSLFPSRFGVPGDYAPMIGMFLGLGISVISLIVACYLPDTARKQAASSKTIS